MPYVWNACETRALVVLKPKLAFFLKRQRKGSVDICLQADFKTGTHVLEWLPVAGLFNSDLEFFLTVLFTDLAFPVPWKYLEFIL